jgi:ElaB/YqjD/DUF883 family membrane-anchored ribosome-binding protein
METHFEFDQAEPGSARKVVQDVRTLLHDVEDVLKEAGQRWGAKSKEELEVALGKMRVAKQKLEVQARRTAERGAEVIREHPYKSLGAAFGVGLLIGLFINRR